MTETHQLNGPNLESLGPEIHRPDFNSSTLSCGIVHLGIGAFHRAHMAFHTQHAINNDPANAAWGIRGVSFRSPVIRDTLAEQEFLYALSSRENENEELEIIGTVRDVIFTGDDPRVCPALIADKTTKIVSMTITEKGYCHDPAMGQLDESHSGIVTDLKNIDQPETAIGAIVQGLRLRRDAKSSAVTLLSCDNLPSNGAVLERIVRRYTELADPSLIGWIDDNVSFPKCMVDRIVPATTDDDRIHIEKALGLRDQSPVIAEAFSQWVIEDNFKTGRPSWENAGVEMVVEVEDYETMKLRLLNGPHSASAYLGYLAGFETVSELMGYDVFPRYLRRMMDLEIKPGITVPLGVDIEAYNTSVLDRFANRALAHRTHQIAMDGSQKLPQRLLGSVRAALKNDLPLDCLALSVAAWMRYVTGIDEQGKSIEVSDPLASELANIEKSFSGDISKLVGGYLQVSEIFGNDLPKSTKFKDAVTKALESLTNKGALQSVADYARK